MDKPLSFSGYKRYMMCPQYYKYHDVEKYRPGKKTSALVFGSIIDTIIGNVLQKTCKDPMGALNKAINEAFLEDLDFYNDDFDADLVDMDKYTEIAKERGWKGDDLTQAVKDMLSSQENLSSSQQTVLKLIIWDCLEVKGQAMINSFTKWILPQIKSVSHLQYYVNNGRIHGYLDFIAELQDGRRVLFDLKTSKMPYSKDAVSTAPQLILYAALMNCDYAGFIVLSKTLKKNKQKSCACGYETTGGNRKKCPDCGKELSFVINPTSYSQLMAEKIPKHKKDLTLKALEDTINCINGSNFPRNLNQCNFMYGRQCPYMNKCWKG